LSAATALRPAASILADGLQVTAFSSSTLNASTLTASHIRVDRNQDSANVGAKAQLSGVATGYDAAANTLVLGNTLIKLAGATVTDLKGKQSPVQNGAYVLVGGSVNSDGSVTAATVKVRTADTTAALAQVLLIGPVTDFVDAGSFVVRGVPVDASNISWATACPGVSPAAGGHQCGPGPEPELPTHREHASHPQTGGHGLGRRPDGQDLHSHAGGQQRAHCAVERGHQLFGTGRAWQH
jgi:hypothetical protein